MTKSWFVVAVCHVLLPAFLLACIYTLLRNENHIFGTVCQVWLTVFLLV